MRVHIVPGVVFRGEGDIAGGSNDPYAPLGVLFARRRLDQIRIFRKQRSRLGRVFCEQRKVRRVSGTHRWLALANGRALTGFGAAVRMRRMRVQWTVWISNRN